MLQHLDPSNLQSADICVIFCQTTGKINPDYIWGVYSTTALPQFFCLLCFAARIAGTHVFWSEVEATASYIRLLIQHYLLFATWLRDRTLFIPHQPFKSLHKVFSYAYPLPFYLKREVKQMEDEESSFFFFCKAAFFLETNWYSWDLKATLFPKSLAETNKSIFKGQDNKVTDCVFRSQLKKYEVPLQWKYWVRN